MLRWVLVALDGSVLLGCAEEQLPKALRRLTALTACRLDHVLHHTNPPSALEPWRVPLPPSSPPPSQPPHPAVSCFPVDPVRAHSNSRTAIRSVSDAWRLLTCIMARLLKSLRRRAVPRRTDASRLKGREDCGHNGRSWRSADRVCGIQRLPVGIPGPSWHQQQVPVLKWRWGWWCAQYAGTAKRLLPVLKHLSRQLLRQYSVPPAAAWEECWEGCCTSFQLLHLDEVTHCLHDTSLRDRL